MSQGVPCACHPTQAFKPAGRRHEWRRGKHECSRHMVVQHAVASEPWRTHARKFCADELWGRPVTKPVTCGGLSGRPGGAESPAQPERLPHATSRKLSPSSLCRRQQTTILRAVSTLLRTDFAGS